MYRIFRGEASASTDEDIDLAGVEPRVSTSEAGTGSEVVDCKKAVYRRELEKLLQV